MGDGARKYLTDAEWLAMFKAQGERCKHCPDTVGPFQADHSNPHYYDSKKPDQLLCVPCHKEKTKADKKLIYHTKRLNGEVSSQASRRADRKERGDRPLIPSRPFGDQSRPMQSRSSFGGSRPMQSRNTLRRERDDEAPRTREQILKGGQHGL